MGPVAAGTGGGTRPPRRDLWVRLAVTAALVALVAALLSAFPGEARWEATWRWRERFLEGLWLTVLISSGALVLGLVLGGLTGLARVSASAALHQAAVVYVEVVRGTPFLVQVYVWYFCVAELGRLHAWAGGRTAALVGVVGLGVFAGAYVAEIVRAGVESVDRGQWEAARSLGLSHRQALRHVVLPQALQRMVPPLTGEAVSLVKESSILSLIGVQELTYFATNMRAREYASLESLVPLAALYLCVTLPLSWLARRLERRLAPPHPLPVARL
jgi:polar amino acid transport system permease protein